MTKLTTRRRKQFLDHLRAGGSVTAAAAVIGVSRTAVYALRERDEAFGQDWDESIEEGTDRLEDEALRRAVEGYEQPVFYRGQRVGTTRYFSDKLLLALLRARRPAAFGPTSARESFNDKEPGLAGLFALAHKELDEAEARGELFPVRRRAGA